MTSLWGNIQMDKVPSGLNSWQFATWSGCFPCLQHKLIILPQAKYTKNTLENAFLLTTAKQRLFLSFTYCSNCSTVTFPICCRAQKVPLENTQQAQYTHRKHQERVTGQVTSDKHSQASFCLRCQDKEQNCSHCPLSLAPMPWSGGSTFFWYLRRMKERESWENASELCTSAKMSPTKFLPLMPQFIFGFPLHSLSWATSGMLQLKAGAATNRTVRHHSCCSNTAQHKAQADTQSPEGPAPKPSLATEGYGYHRAHTKSWH